MPDPMHTIAVVNQKGGVGKTTVALNLAAGLQKYHGPTALIDADHQRSITVWDKKSEGDLDVYRADSANIHEKVPQLEAGYEAVVIDTAGGASDEVDSALQAATAVLVPVRPSGFDLWSTQGTLKHIQATTGAPIFLLVSQQIVGTNLADTITDPLEAFDATLLEARTSMRVAYQKAVNARTPVYDVGDDKAAEEIDALTTELLSYLNR